jgi:hypothetical protein
VIRCRQVPSLALLQVYESRCDMFSPCHIELRKQKRGLFDSWQQNEGFQMVVFFSFFSQSRTAVAPPFPTCACPFRPVGARASVGLSLITRIGQSVTCVGVRVCVRALTVRTVRHEGRPGLGACAGHSLRSLRRFIRDASSRRHICTQTPSPTQPFIIHHHGHAGYGPW